MVVSAVNGSDRCPDGVVSAANEAALVPQDDDRFDAINCIVTAEGSFESSYFF